MAAITTRLPTTDGMITTRLLEELPPRGDDDADEVGTGIDDGADGGGLFVEYLAAKLATKLFIVVTYTHIKLATMTSL